MKNPPRSQQGSAWQARTLDKVVRARGQERKPRGEGPPVGRGAGFSGGISFHQPVNTYLMSSFQVPGPEPAALRGQRLRVTAKLPCLSKSVIAHSPPTVQVSRQVNSHTRLSSSPLATPLCSLGGWGFALPLHLNEPRTLWLFSISPSVFWGLFVGLFLGISVSAFFLSPFASLSAFWHNPLSPSPPGSPFMPFFQATHSHFSPLLFSASSLFCFFSPLL